MTSGRRTRREGQAAEQPATPTSGTEERASGQDGGVVTGTEQQRSRRERQEAIQARMERLSERAQEERGRRGWVDATFEVVDRDGEVAGGIIAGALAYRLFIWLLPFGLVFVGGLGVVAAALSDSPKDVGSKLGVGGIVSSSLSSASKSHSAWYALIVGVPILLYATRSVLRVLIGTHRLAWGEETPTLHDPSRRSSMRRSCSAS
jgi:uncharacterized BrkB/YihY/UPF0761 family membrane protein